MLCFISQINAAVQHCLDYFEFCKAAVNKNSKVSDFSQHYCSEYLCMSHIICACVHILCIFKHAEEDTLSILFLPQMLYDCLLKEN